MILQSESRIPGAGANLKNVHVLGQRRELKQDFIPERKIMQRGIEEIGPAKRKAQPSRFPLGS